MNFQTKKRIRQAHRPKSNYEPRIRSLTRLAAKGTRSEGGPDHTRGEQWSLDVRTEQRGGKEEETEEERGEGEIEEERDKKRKRRGGGRDG